MTQIFTAFLLTSVIGTALALILTLLRPVTRKAFSASWHYYVWLIVLVVMVLPIRLNLPAKPVTIKPYVETLTITDDQDENTEIPIIIETQPKQIVPEQPMQSGIVSSAKNFLSDKVLLFSFIWFIGAVLIFLIKLISYLTFLIKTHKHSELIYCPEVNAYTNRNIKTRVSDTICSPLLIGIIRPTLLLPKKAIALEQLHNVLAHEMTHLRRNDILYKWFVNVVKCVHWFNPVIYFISNQINIDCEISCDLAVVKEMDEQQEKGYVETILSLLTRSNSKSIPLTTGMTGNKKILKRRFIMIKKRKNIGTVTQVLSTILAVVIFATTVFTSGVLATEILKKNNSENTVDIEVRHNGFLVELSNKPFYENNVLYLPLRELLEKTGLVDNTDSYIKWDNGKIILCITEGDNIPDYDDAGNQTGNKPIKIQYYYGIEIGKAEYILNPTGTLPKERQHLSQSKEMTNAPVLKDGVTYIPYEYIDYMVNRVMQNHKIIVWKDVSGATDEDISNAENMTYEDIRNLQISVDNGHSPWRLDPTEVIKTFLLSKGISVNNIRVPESTVTKLTYTDSDIEIKLFKPIDKTKSGIWVVKSFRYGKEKNINNIFFYDTTPYEKMIEKQEDGWYDLPTKTITASFPDIDSPVSVTAYYAEEGRSLIQELGKITVPHDFQTMSKVLSMKILFSQEEIYGRLWFNIVYENGEKISTEDFKVYRKVMENQTKICAFVKEIKGNKIIVDAAEYVSKEDTKRIKELNLTDFDMPNGYYIHNTEVVLEEQTLTETSTYSFIDWKNDFVEFGEDRRFDTTDKEDFIKYLNSYENSQPKMPFFLDIADGKVIKITEIPLM